MKPDVEILAEIVRYCDEALEEMIDMGTDEEDLLESKIYQKCVAFNIIQIGEQVKRLSDDLKNTYDFVDWINIAGMRNYMAHKYHRMTPTFLWKAISENIPQLKEDCLKIMADLKSSDSEDS